MLRLYSVCNTPVAYHIDDIEVLPWQQFLEALFVGQTLL